MPYAVASINIVTMDGKTVSQYPIAGQGSGSISFDGSTVAGGIYKYSLIIDGRIMDTKSMSIASK